MKHVKGTHLIILNGSKREYMEAIAGAYTNGPRDMKIVSDTSREKVHEKVFDAPMKDADGEYGDLSKLKLKIDDISLR